nr:AraC family transcriptional regulator [Lachnospiraceae bacterium]
MLTSLESREFLRNLNLKLFLLETPLQVLESAHGVFQKSFPRHMHSFYELHYIYGGKGKLLTDKASIPLGTGDLFLIPPHYYHEQLTDPVDHMEEFHVAFSIPVSNPSTPLTYALNSLGFSLLHTTLPFDIYYEAIDQELVKKDAYTKDMLEALFRELLIRVFRLILPSAATHKITLSEAEKRLLTMDQIFLYQYATITLPEMAKALSLSPNHTCRLIKEHYGKTFIEMRSLTRLNAAAEMLYSTTRPISQISDLCGFSNPIYFTQEFKKEFHMTPRDYRKQH